MTTPTKHETEIAADPNLPTIQIIREFDAPRERVFAAFTDAALVAQWLGPRSMTMRIDMWECHTGGRYRYVSIREGTEYGFYGSFHEVRPDERIVQTFTYEEYPDSVSLETAEFAQLDGDRTRVTILSFYNSMEARDGMIAGGMDTGVIQGFEKLDALLAA